MINHCTDCGWERLKRVEDKMATARFKLPDKEFYKLLNYLNGVTDLIKTNEEITNYFIDSNNKKILMIKYGKEFNMVYDGEIKFSEKESVHNQIKNYLEESLEEFEIKETNDELANLLIGMNNSRKYEEVKNLKWNKK